jgi:hypothetical protein
MLNSCGSFLVAQDTDAREQIVRHMNTVDLTCEGCRTMWFIQRHPLREANVQEKAGHTKIKQDI